MIKPRLSYDSPFNDEWDEGGRSASIDDYSSLVERLAAEGDEIDRNKGFEWEPIGAVVQDTAHTMSRRMSPDYMAEDELGMACLGLDLDIAAKTREAFSKAIGACESPIEKFILPWLISQRYPYFDHNPCVLFPGEGAQLVDKTVAVIPQLPIAGYRADFALAARRGGAARFVVVECDGAAFHDKPKDVVRDVDRDVRILANPRVLEIVRISGSDIYRSPRNAADTACRELVRAWKNLTGMAKR